MAKSITNKEPKLLTRVVKGLGHWLGPETPTGKAFVAAEKGMSKAFDRLGRNDSYLNFAGGALNRALRLRAAYVESQENWLNVLRMPSLTEFDELREEVRDIHNQIEALSSQLEVVLETLEKSRPQTQGTEASKPSANGTVPTDHLS